MRYDEKAGPLAEEVRIQQTVIRFFLLADENGKPYSFFLDIDFDQLRLICWCFDFGNGLLYNFCFIIYSIKEIFYFC